MQTSKGKTKSKFLSKITGIKSMAPAGGKFIFILSKVINKTTHAIKTVI